MATSYLDLTNTLLQDFNEPTLTAGNFDSVRSVHRVAKNAINRAIDNIQTKEYTWPFNKASGSQTLVIGQSLYTWPADKKWVDMNSFYIEKNDTFGNNTRILKSIAEQEWRNHYRKNDLDADSSVGLQLPEFVFATNNGWGVTRLPNKTYSVKYDYWTTWTSLSASTDTPSIPSDWDHVIIAHAYPAMQKFYNNDNEYDRSVVDAKDLLQDMRQILIPKEQKFWVGQLDKGGYYV